MGNSVCVTCGQRQGRATNLLVPPTAEAFLTISMAKEGGRVGTSSDRTHLCSELWGSGQSLFRDWSWAEWLPWESAGGDRGLHTAPPWRYLRIRGSLEDTSPATQLSAF